MKKLKSIYYPSNSCYNLCGPAKTNDQWTTSYDVSYFKNTIAPIFQGPTDNGDATNPNSVHWNALFTSSSSAPVTYRVTSSFEVMLYEFKFFFTYYIRRYLSPFSSKQPSSLPESAIWHFNFYKVAIFFWSNDSCRFFDQTFRKIRFIFSIPTLKIILMRCPHWRCFLFSVPHYWFEIACFRFITLLHHSSSKKAKFYLSPLACHPWYQFVKSRMRS